MAERPSPAVYRSGDAWEYVWRERRDYRVTVTRRWADGCPRWGVYRMRYDGAWYISLWLYWFCICVEPKEDRAPGEGGGE